MPIRPALAAVLTLALATGAAAQRPAPPASLTLLQMEIVVPQAWPAAQRLAAARTFAADTRAIRVCGDALRLADRYKAQKKFTGTLTVRNGVPLRALPPRMQAELTSRPVGRASRVYPGPNALRVLVSCTPTLDTTNVDRTI